MAGNGPNRLHQATPDDVRDDSGTLRQDFDRLRVDVRSFLRNGAQLGRDGGRHLADTAHEQGKQIADSMRTGGEKVRRTVQEHPLTAIGCALGVGLIAGILLRR